MSPDQENPRRGKQQEKLDPQSVLANSADERLGWSDLGPFTQLVISAAVILAIAMVIVLLFAAKGGRASKLSQASQDIAIAKAPARMSHELADLTALESAQITTMTAVTAFWFFCVGGCLGSFLNVVVYRLPRGMSLVRKKSSCPNCDQAIEMRDNIPILGWVKLHGRCRHCHWPIPIRYPLVELAVASQVVVLLFVELMSGGANLPVRQTEFYSGVVWTVWYLKYPDLLQLYLFHCLLLYLSLAFMLIAADRQRPPWRLIGLGLLVGLTWLAIEPNLQPVLGLSPSGSSGGWSHRRAAIWSGLVGMIWGAGMGGILGWALPDAEDAPKRAALGAIFSLCGLYLGASVVLSVATITILIYLAARLIAVVTPGAKSFSLVVSLVLAIHIQVLFWRQLSNISYWPSHAQEWYYHSEILLGVVCVIVMIRERNRRPLVF